MSLHECFMVQLCVVNKDKFIPIFTEVSLITKPVLCLEDLVTTSVYCKRDLKRPVLHSTNFPANSQRRRWSCGRRTYFCSFGTTENTPFLFSLKKLDRQKHLAIC